MYKKLMMLMVFCLGDGIIAKPPALPNLGNSCYMNALLQNFLNFSVLNNPLLALKDTPGGTLIPAYIDVLKEYEKGDIKNDTLKNFYKSVDVVMGKMPFILWMRNVAQAVENNRELILEQMKVEKDKLTKEIDDAKKRFSQTKDSDDKDFYERLEAKNNTLIDFLTDTVYELLEENKREKNKSKTVSFNFFSDLEKRFVQDVALSYRQEDAAEFYTNFLNRLYDPEEMFKDSIKDFFKIKTVELYSSKGSSVTLEKNDISFSLALNVLNGDSIKKCLDYYFQKKDVTDEVDFDGVRRSDAQNQFFLTSIPDILTCQVGRYNDYGIKSGKGCKASLNINVYNYCNNALKKKLSKEEAQYSLVGIVMHHGSSPKSGHYTAYIKDSKNLWWLCDDSSIKEIGKKLKVYSDKFKTDYYDYEKVGSMFFYMRSGIVKVKEKSKLDEKKVKELEKKISYDDVDLTHLDKALELYETLNVKTKKENKTE